VRATKRRPRLRHLVSLFREDDLMPCPESVASAVARTDIARDIHAYFRQCCSRRSKPLTDLGRRFTVTARPAIAVAPIERSGVFAGNARRPGQDGAHVWCIRTMPTGAETPPYFRPPVYLFAQLLAVHSLVAANSGKPARQY
jgi:hypothetical protein